MVFAAHCFAPIGICARVPAGEIYDYSLLSSLVIIHTLIPSIYLPLVFCSVLRGGKVIFLA